MAQTPMKLLSIETGTLTSSFTVTGGAYIKKQDKIVDAYISINDVDVEAGGVIANIPQGYRPIQDIIVIGFEQLANNSILRFSVNSTSGDVSSPTAISTNGRVRLKASWMTS